MPTTTATPMSVRYLSLILDALPSYAEVTVHYSNSAGDPLTHVLMARDMPRTSRRFTSLTSGFEVMDVETYLRNVIDFSLGTVTVDIPALHIEVRS